MIRLGGYQHLPIGRTNFQAEPDRHPPALANRLSISDEIISKPWNNLGGFWLWAMMIVDVIARKRHIEGILLRHKTQRDKILPIFGIRTIRSAVARNLITIPSAFVVGHRGRFSRSFADPETVVETATVPGLVA